MRNSLNLWMRGMKDVSGQERAISKDMKVSKNKQDRDSDSVLCGLGHTASKSWALNGKGDGQKCHTKAQVYL